MSGSSTCKYCGRPVVWAKTGRDKNMCVDPEPSPRGEYVLEAAGVKDGRVDFVVRHQRADDTPGRRYRSHFDTCPKWRAQARS